MANAEEGADENERLQKILAKRYRELQIEEQKKAVARQLLEPAAYERLMNIRVANYELYKQLLDLLVAMAQNNKLGRKISEEEFKQLLVRLTSKPETTIHIQHK
ncbi:MAG: DNA-binding protein [Candidatus Micrarchaeia archaeon]